jgi:hypothetical protein
MCRTGVLMVVKIIFQFDLRLSILTTVYMSGRGMGLLGATLFN